MIRTEPNPKPDRFRTDKIYLPYWVNLSKIRTDPNRQDPNRTQPINSNYPIGSKYLRPEGPRPDKTQPEPDPRTRMPMPNKNPDCRDTESSKPSRPKALARAIVDLLSSHHCCVPSSSSRCRTLPLLPSRSAGSHHCLPHCESQLFEPSSVETSRETELVGGLAHRRFINR